MIEFLRIWTKVYSYFIDDGNKDKNTKDTKICVIKANFKFEDYKNCLEKSRLENKINHLENYETDENSL